MVKMNREQVVEGLAQYGYELLRPTRSYKGEDLLLNLLKQDDARLLEGFPVAYENLLRNKKQFEWDNPKWQPTKKLSKQETAKLLYLLTLSYLLFKLYGEDKTYLQRTEKLLSKVAHNWKEYLNRVSQSFNLSDPVKFDKELSLSSERLKHQYRNYVVHRTQTKNLVDTTKDLELELLLSEFFTPKQKELIKKRQFKKSLTKTEREYYYRVVSKRLKALANENLSQYVKSLVT